MCVCVHNVCVYECVCVGGGGGVFVVLFCFFLHSYCSAQLSMLNMEKHYRNKIIIIIILKADSPLHPQNEQVCLPVCSSSSSAFSS